MFFSWKLRTIPILFGVLILALSAVPLTAKPKPVSGDFTVSLIGRGEFGQLGEYVFAPDAQTSIEGSQVASELLWDIKPAWFFGMSGEYIFPRRFFLGGSYLGAMPAGTGYMYDRDWLAVDLPFRVNQLDPDSPTRYSRHDVYLTGAHAGELFLGRWFVLVNGMHLTPLVGFGVKYYAMNATDGTGVYSSGNVTFYGTVISYRQYYTSFFLGASAVVSPLEQLSITATIKGSPGLTSVEAIDHHYRRNMEFYDEISGGMMLEGEIRFDLNTSSSSSIWFALGGSMIPQMQGKTTTLFTSTGYVPQPTENGAGASLYIARLSAGTRIIGSIFK